METEMMICFYTIFLILLLIWQWYEKDDGTWFK